MTSAPPRRGTFLLVLAVALGLARPAAALELLTNGGFETGDSTGWTVTDLPPGTINSFFVDGNPLFTPLSSSGTVGPKSGAFYAVSDQTGEGTHAVAQA